MWVKCEYPVDFSEVMGLFGYLPGNTVSKRKIRALNRMKYFRFDSEGVIRYFKNAENFKKNPAGRVLVSEYGYNRSGQNPAGREVFVITAQQRL